MIPVSSRWQTAVTGNFTAYEELWLTSVDPPRKLLLSKENTGEVIEDQTAKIRYNGTFNIIIDSDDLVPVSYRRTSSPLNPLQKPTVQYVRGVVYGDGTRESIIQATMQVRKVRGNRNEPGWLELTCYDRFADLQRLSATPLTIPAGFNAADAIRRLLWQIDPTLPFLMPTTPYTFPSLVYNVQSDYVQLAEDLAKSIGMELHMDRIDRCVLEPTALKDGPLNWTWSPTTGVMIDDDMEFEIDADQIYNGVTVTGQHSSMTDPLIVSVWDNDPTSLTYYLGEFGQNPRFITTEKATTIPQLQDMARSELQRILGGVQEFTLRMPPNAAITTNDRGVLDFPKQGVDRLVVLVRRIKTVTGDPGAQQEIVVQRGVDADAA